VVVNWKKNTIADELAVKRFVHPLSKVSDPHIDLRCGVGDTIERIEASVVAVFSAHETVYSEPTGTVSEFLETTREWLDFRWNPQSIDLDRRHTGM
jgi:hypothetical protein